MPSTRTVSKALATSSKTRLWAALSKFMPTFSKRRASCSDVLCLGLNLNCWSRRSPRPLTSLRILARRYFQTPCQSCPKELWDVRKRAVSVPFRVSGWRPHERGSVRVESAACEESLWISQWESTSPAGGLFYWAMRYTFRAWCLGDLESSRGLFTWAGLLAQDVCVQGHVKHLSNSEMQLAINRLKLSLQSSNNLVCTETPNVPTVLLTLHLVVVQLLLLKTQTVPFTVRELKLQNTVCLTTNGASNHTCRYSSFFVFLCSR